MTQPFARSGTSVRARLVMIVALAILPPGVLNLGQIYLDYLQDRAAIEAGLRAAAEEATSSQDDIVSVSRPILKALASQTAVIERRQPDCSVALFNALLGAQMIRAMAVTDKAGNVACIAPSTEESLNLGDREWFQQIMGGAPFVLSEFVKSRVTNQDTIIAAVPIWKEDSVVGALSLGIDLTVLVRKVSELRLPPDTRVGLMDASGHVLELAGQFPLELFDSSRLQELRAERTQPVILRGRFSQQDEFVVAAAPIHEKSLFVLYGRESASLYGWLKVRLLRNLAAPLLIWVVAMVAAWYAASHTVLQWIERLRGVAIDVAHGRPPADAFDFRDAPREIRDLNDTLSSMTGTIARQTVALTESLEQRDRLIREIHHRIKNNLQIISSLVNLQARKFGQGAGQSALMTIRDRIRALSLIHQKLYETSDYEQIDLRALIDTLTSQLAELHGSDQHGIALECEIPELGVSAESGSAVAMLVTEAVTNAIKHAFPAGATGRIVVTITQQPDKSAVLTIADNGAGLASPESSEQPASSPSPSPLTSPGSNSLGMALMQGFARQLGGRLTVATENGTVVRVDIPNLE